MDTTGGCGSAESQILFFTNRIRNLTEHMQMNKHDYTAKRGLLNVVNKRRKMIKYLRRVDSERCDALLKTVE